MFLLKMLVWVALANRGFEVLGNLAAEKAKLVEPDAFKLVDDDHSKKKTLRGGSNHIPPTSEFLLEHGELEKELAASRLGNAFMKFFQSHEGKEFGNVGSSMIMDEVVQASAQERREFIETLKSMAQKGFEDLSTLKQAVGPDIMPFLTALLKIDDDDAKKIMSTVEDLIGIFKSLEAQENWKHALAKGSNIAHQALETQSATSPSVVVVKAEAKKNRAERQQRRRVKEAREGRDSGGKSKTEKVRKDHSPSFGKHLGNMLGAKAKSFLSRTQQTPGVQKAQPNFYGKHARKLGIGNRELSNDPKADLCALLVACVNAMSYYDIFVLFYSDDIDIVSGDVDGNVFKFDEVDLVAKFDEVKRLAGLNECDQLLMMFHRSVEKNGIANWEGSTVGQVCLAEGTTVYVKMGSIARSFLHLPEAGDIEGTLVASEGCHLVSGRSTWKFWVDVNIDGTDKERTDDDVKATFYSERNNRRVCDSYFVNGMEYCNEGSEEKGKVKGETEMWTIQSYYPIRNVRLEIDGHDLLIVDRARLYKGIYNPFNPNQIGTDDNMGDCLSTDESDGTNYDRGCKAHRDYTFSYAREGFDHWEHSGKRDLTVVECIVECKDAEFVGLGHTGDEDKVDCWCSRSGITASDISNGGSCSPCSTDGDCGGDHTFSVYSTVTTAVFENLLTNLKTTIEDQYNALSDQLAGEPFRCAEELWSHGGGQDVFPFHTGFVNAEWRFQINISHRDITGEETEGEVTANFYSERNDGGSSSCSTPIVISDIEYCHEGSASQVGVTEDATYWSIWSYRTIRVVQLEISGDNSDDALFVDRVHLIKDGEKVQSIGSNDGSGSSAGHCLSTNANANFGANPITPSNDAIKDAQALIASVNVANAINVAVPCYPQLDFEFNTYTEDDTAWETVTSRPIEEFAFPTAIDYESSARDDHGHVISLEESGFLYESYDHLQANVDTCFHEEAVTVKSDCEDQDQVIADYKICIFDGAKQAILDCYASEFFDVLDTSLGLVFGGNPSPGYICGTKEAVLQHGKALPGSCCLDSPNELQGEFWGHAYECSSTCNHLGPYLAGIDSNACEAQGGTWCQNPVDCSALSACVEDMKNNALETNHAAFENYLNSMPNITDPLNADHCGKAREYFGFDATFINDDTVCAEVDELRHSRNLDWMDEFFGQGTSETTAPGGTSGCPPPLPPVELEIPEMAEFDVLNEVDSSLSTSDTVKNGGAWKATNFALRQAADVVCDVIDALADTECPDVWPTPTHAICTVAKAGLYYVGKIIYIVLRTVLDISEYTRGVVATIGAGQEIEIWETTQAIHENMINTGVYMRDGFQEVLNFIGEANQAVLDYVHTANGGRKLLLEGTDEDLELDFETKIVEALAAHSSSGLQEMKHELDDFRTNSDAKFEDLRTNSDAKFEDLRANSDAKFDELNAKFDAGTLDLMIQVVKNQDPTTLMVVTAFRGTPVQTDIEVLGYDEEKEEDALIPFESKTLGSGKVLLKLKESAKFLTIKSVYRVDENKGSEGLVVERSELVSIME